MKDMFYLLRVGTGKTPRIFDEGKEKIQYGLFLFEGRHYKPAIDKQKKPEDLGAAIADFFKGKFGPIDSIAATEMLEVVELPTGVPAAEFTEDGMIVYNILKSSEYVKIIKNMTEKLDRK